MLMLLHVLSVSLILLLSGFLVVYLIILIDMEIFYIKFKMTMRKIKKKIEDIERNGQLNEGVTKYIENTFRAATQEVKAIGKILNKR